MADNHDVTVNRDSLEPRPPDALTELRERLQKANDTPR